MGESYVDDINRMISAKLAPHGIVGSARIVDNHIEAEINAGQWIDLKAEKHVRGREFQFAGMIQTSEAQRLGPAALAGSFSAQAIHALAKSTRE
jgi:hypothetical protein